MVECWTDSPTSEKSLVTKTNRVTTGLMEGRRPGEIRNRSLWRRQDDDDLSRRVLLSGPGGKRHTGRPRLRWEDGVEEDAARLGCINWKIVALNREGWRKLLKKAEAHPGL